MKKSSKLKRRKAKAKIAKRKNDDSWAKGSKIGRHGGLR